MRPIWHLSINALVGRRSRTALLTTAVALSTTLIAAVSCALASLNAGMTLKTEAQFGKADVRIQHIGEERFTDQPILSQLTSDPRVELAAPRAGGPLPLRNPANDKTAAAIATGIDPDAEYALVEPRVAAGRVVRADGEIVLAIELAERLGVTVGDTLELDDLFDPIPFTVVGLVKATTIQVVAIPEASVTIASLNAAQGEGGGVRLKNIQVKLRDGEDAKAFAADFSARIEDRALVADPTEKITAGVQSNVRANRLMLLLATTLAFISASFIVLTGMTTSIIERQRELAILRCIGAQRRHLALGQLGFGAAVGIGGALVGVPLGIFLGWLLTIAFPDRLPAGLHIEARGLIQAGSGAILAGLLGALLPAIGASRTKPLRAMASMARAPRWWVVPGCGALAIALIAAQQFQVNMDVDADTLFFWHLWLGLPMLFLGAFILGIPVCVAVSMLLRRPLARLMGVPQQLLSHTAESSPIRTGITAGSLMVGLALMVSIWTDGKGLLDDWLGSMRFPEAFVRAWGGMEESDEAKLQALTIVERTSPITDFRIDAGDFGTKLVRQARTSFVAIDPDSFFDLNSIVWIQGDPEQGIERLRGGGAVVVAKEFIVNRPEFGVGKPFPVEFRGETVTFDVVGVVTSPGLEMISKYFNVGKEQTEVALHSVIGSRDDLKSVFKTDRVDFIQVKLAPGVTDEQATTQLREALDNTLLVVGSGRAIKDEINTIAVGSMRIMSLVAIAAMLIGVTGVGSIVIAGIDARRFEFGVLRAIGAQGSMLGRLIACEVLLLAISACVVGVVFGLLNSMTARRLWEVLLGIEVGLNPPLLPIAAGCASLIILTLGLTMPIILRLSKARSRELLAATRG